MPILSILSIFPFKGPREFGQLLAKAMAGAPGASGASVGATSAAGAAGEEYFAKFLTSSHLMSLELRDPHFRRHILVQVR